MPNNRRIENSEASLLLHFDTPYNILNQLHYPWQIEGGA